jgi:hypothetical protein
MLADRKKHSPQPRKIILADREKHSPPPTSSMIGPLPQHLAVRIKMLFDIIFYLTTQWVFTNIAIARWTCAKIDTLTVL